MAYEMVMPYHLHMPSYLFRQLELVYTNSSEVYPLGNARQL